MATRGLIIRLNDSLIVLICKKDVKDRDVWIFRGVARSKRDSGMSTVHILFKLFQAFLVL